MKKIFTPVIKRCVALVVFILTQVKVWATDTIPATDKTESLFSQPWIWIGAIVVTMISLLGPTLRVDSSEVVVIRKKAGKNRKY